jgi:hypothetical protein
VFNGEVAGLRGYLLHQKLIVAKKSTSVVPLRNNRHVTID